MTNTWSESRLRTAVEYCVSVRKALFQLGLSCSPGNYRSFYKHTSRLGIDISHFKGKSHGTTIVKKPLESILVENGHMTSSNLKRRLLKEGLLENVCALCGQETTWNYKPLSLQLDHIDGNSSNNILSNLRILCPNCHAQTPTFRGGNRYKNPENINTCEDCGKPIWKGSKRCVSCQGKLREKKWPPAEDLARKVEESTYVTVAKELGVSDSAVRKHLKRELGYTPKKYKCP